MLSAATGYDLGTSLMSSILSNFSLVTPDSDTIILHARMIAATFKMHNYCRENDRPVSSAEQGWGARMISRLIRDINIRNRRHRDIRHNKKHEKRARRGVLHRGFICTAESWGSDSG